MSRYVVKNIFFGKEVRYGIQRLGEPDKHTIKYSQINPDLGHYRGEEITSSSILGIGSEIEISDNSDLKVIEYVYPKAPFYCDRCGREFDSFMECKKHARDCDFRGYIDN